MEAYDGHSTVFTGEKESAAALDWELPGEERAAARFLFGNLVGVTVVFDNLLHYPPGV